MFKGDILHSKFVWSGHVGWAEFSAGPLGRGSHTGTEANLSQKGNTAGVLGCGTYYKQVRQSLALCFTGGMWLCVYAEVQGRERVPASSFVLGDGSLVLAALREALQGEQIICLLCVPSIFQITVPVLSGSSCSLPAFSPGAEQCPLDPIPQPSIVACKILGLGPLSDQWLNICLQLRE